MLKNGNKTVFPQVLYHSSQVRHPAKKNLLSARKRENMKKKNNKNIFWKENVLIVLFLISEPIIILIFRSKAFIQLGSICKIQRIALGG